jgi:PAS domain S-box-containing protein
MTTPTEKKRPASGVLLPALSAVGAYLCKAVGIALNASEGLQADLSHPSELEVLDPSWVVRMLRLGFFLAILTVLGDIGQVYYIDPQTARLILPFDLIELAASIIAAALTFRSSFTRQWKPVTLGYCLLLVGIITPISVMLRDQTRLFVAIMVLLSATCALVPWEALWQAILTGGLVALAAIATVFLPPLNVDGGGLWVSMLAVAAVALVSNRLWARWRLALADTCRRLERSETQLRAVLDANLDQVSVIRLSDGRFVYVNDEFLKRGYERESVLGRSGREFGMWPEDGELRDFRDRLKADGFVRNREVQIRMADGRIAPHLISSALAELQGEPCVISVGRDITEIKRAQDDLIAAQQAALAASRAKSEFLSSMSHEIRTPMNAILGMADLLGETPLTPEQRRFADTMARNGNALLDLINGILDLAKVESGRLNLEETEFDLGEVVEHVAETLAVRAHEKGLELATRILPDVPLRLVGDQLRLRQILINLVGNAIKFTDRGEVVLTVESDCEPQSHGNGGERLQIRFSVSDTGIGIPTDQLETIFQSFTQADSSVTRRYGGSGLGLAIVRRLVELMGGRIWTQSEVGKGSVFCFTALFKPAVETKTELTEGPCLDGVRVLVADDNAASRSILRELLSARGAAVSEVAGATQALAQIDRARDSAEPYRLALIDCGMSDGFDVAQRLRRGEGAPAIIAMLTSENLNPKVARARELSIAYVVKPIKRTELMRAIAESTGRVQVEFRKPPLSPPEGPGTGGRRPLRILLAEDSRDNRMLIEAYLKNLPYDLDPADNGEVAVEKFRRRSYDLVLMDMQMPVMDGYSATRKIRLWERERNQPMTPIVALTASALEEDIRNTLNAGCTVHLSKPVKKSRLLNLIDELVSPAQSRSEAVTDLSSDHPS